MAPYSNLNDIEKEIVVRDGVMTLLMSELTKAYGKERGGGTVRAGIALELESLGIGHIPSELPNWGNTPVRVFKKGTPVARIIAAAQSVGENHDEELRKIASTPYSKIVQQIRELVCE